jgi:cellulose 1,4-beta-cellobiosidase
MKAECSLGDYNSKQVAPRIKITNTGSATVDLTTVEIRAWYSNETAPNAQGTTCWWAGNVADCSGVHVTITASGSSTAGADTVASYKFTSGSLPAGQNEEIHLGINPTPWADYILTNDYSDCSTFASMTVQPHIAVYVSGALAWGVEP